ncbi:MAG TPA: calcium/sodium antiporter [Kineosporiaceae bacterium]|nr:calcium/sodium antiporter [Kineosporiaceae bacterium]
MLTEVLLCAVGLVVLSVAADHLVQGSSRLAAWLRINPIVVGIVVIGFGTSAPEFLVSATAAARGDTGIAVGNIVGSNILNLTLILGIAALLADVRVRASVVAHESRLAVIAVAVFAVFAWQGLNPVTGVLLAVLLFGALAVLIRWALADRSPAMTVEVCEFIGSEQIHPPFSDLDTESAHSSEDDTGGEFQDYPDAARYPAHPVRRASIRALIGLGGVLLGSQVLVVNASAIATRFGVSQVIIGLTLIALGTSLPELVTTVQAQRRGESALVVGNLFGSNLFNSLGGGAVIGLASGSAHPAKASVVSIVIMVATAVLAWVLLRRDLRVSRSEGLILLAVYVLTLPLLLVS